MSPTDHISSVIDNLADGDRIDVYVDPHLYQPCEFQLCLLGLPARPQWVRGTLRKLTSMHTALVLAPELEPLPMTRTYRRCSSYGMGGHYKRAFFSYVKRVSAPTNSTERGL